MSGINDYARLEVQINGEQAKQRLKQLEERAFRLRNAIAAAAIEGNKFELKQLRKEYSDTQKELRQMQNKVVEGDCAAPGRDWGRGGKLRANCGEGRRDTARGIS